MAKKFHAIQRSGKGFHVIAKSTGEPLSKHPFPTRAHALAQLRAVEWSQHKPGGSKEGE
jgi:hypothetical protein